MRLLSLFIALIAFALPARADDALERVEAYLNTLTTIESEFVQIAPDGSIASGRFFLKRPGKMRWQYEPPMPVLIIANHGELVYYDYQLDQVSHIPLDETLAGFLAQDDIRFNTDTLKILEQSAKDGVIRIRLTQKESPEDGELTLEFSDAPLQLRNMIVKDATGQETNVSLNNARFGIPLENKLFIFRDPRIFKQR